jgi:hypothetical protein
MSSFPAGRAVKTTLEATTRFQHPFTALSRLLHFSFSSLSERFQLERRRSGDVPQRHNRAEKKLACPGVPRYFT